MKQPDNNFEIAELVTKFLEGQLLNEESEELNNWIAESEDNRRIWQRMIDPVYLEKKLQYWNDKDSDIHWQALRNDLDKRRPTWKTVSLKALKYAAILIPILLFSGIGWFLLGKKDKNKGAEQTTDLVGIRILPKGKIAKLVMGNGKIVQLTDSLKGAITEKDGTKVRNQGSTLHYLADNKDKEDIAIFNTLITPRGGEYQIILADGTKVWLNAASSLRFPTQFKAKERKVYLSGEAYFEVAKDEQHPFIVNARKMDITVLGTEFNVSSYPDDSKQTTTLAEGSVRINYKNANIGNKEGVLLQPGYEAVINAYSDKIQVGKANIKAALAWKDGLFIFNSEPLGQIMRTLSRWYNVKVNYEKGMDTMLHFTGRIRKYKNITGILEKLEMTEKIQFNVEGREVKVIKFQKINYKLPNYQINRNE